MRILTLLTLIISFRFSLCAQNIVLLQDPVTNRSFNSTKYSEIKGSPFLINKWINGSATIDKGTYNNIELKLDAYDNQVLFKFNDDPFEFKDEVKSFVLKPQKDSASYLYFKKGLTGTGLKPNQYVQILVGGKVSLYKSDVKLVSEVNEINRGVVQAFNTTSRYYIVKDNITQLVKFSKNDILNIMKDRDSVVNDFIATSNLSFKKENDIIALIRYYNSL